jgi:hypothetical protein
MRILSLLIFCVVLIFFNRQGDSPHGTNFKISCSTCHSSKGWQLDKEIYSFNHNKTKLPLVGQHAAVNCRQCHISLVFSEAKSECFQCHKDVHQGTTGLDCSRCHTSESWLVKNINEIHQNSRFPLLGAHRTADCSQCHKSESLARFDVPGINCIDCHRPNYLATSNPNHVQAGFSEDCTSCHHIYAFQWSGAGFNHNTFPLVQGHSVPKCADCHTSGVYTNTSPVCNSCHQPDFLAAKNPDHVSSGFSTTCQDCHSLASGWKPTTFDHSKFPLNLGHSTPACADCHTSGNYSTTPTDCYSCHQQNYLATTNPNHSATNFPKTCQTCHTLNPGWKPATFNHTSFPLTLGHSTPVCADCHKGGNYTSTSKDCVSCHLADYNGSTNPNHKTLNFSTTCTQCHTTNPGWKPAAYTQHDAQSFPIYSGRHKGQWSSCTDCHSNPTNYALFNCISCHANAHRGKNYTNAQCYTCHPKGSGG